MKMLTGFNWRLPLYLGAIVCALCYVVGDDGIQLFLLFLVAPLLALLCVALLVSALAGRYRRNCLWLAGAIALFFITATALIVYQRDDPQSIRSTVRWLFESRHYKAAVLAQAEPPAGELKHASWDGWGFVASGETVIYLVHDPSESLFDAAKQRRSDLVAGVPCPVDRVHRLEAHWYTVLYPTDSGWADCRLSGAQSQPTEH